MTRLETLRTADPKDVAQMICDMLGEYSWTLEDLAKDSSVFPHYCRACPGYKTCKPGHVGLIDWLNEEAEK